MPIRTGLDERLTAVKTNLGDYFQRVYEMYADAVNGIIQLDRSSHTEIKEERNRALERNWELSNDLLLIIAINQPLMEDLRIVSTYLRAADTIERLARHARDISKSTKKLSKDKSMVDKIPSGIATLLNEIWKVFSDLFLIISRCMVESKELPQEKIRELWHNIEDIHHKSNEKLSEISREDLGDRSNLFEFTNVFNRIERSGYNLTRLADLWHFALHNENIRLER
ncbi:MAG: PhoU domain-containing protein [Candidatus Thermoplasmatota archaeon]|nr:PhoU domain-containing protein [Candidatus Thermoplasmatota archaeon]